MSADQNMAILQRFAEELWNGRKLSVADEIFSPDCVTHQLKSGSALSTTPRDPETLKKHVTEWLVGFPDLHFDIEQIISHADRVVSQLLMQATHTGTWLGIRPSNKRVSIRMMTIHRIIAGMIVEDWVLVESLGFFQQLGVLPATTELLSKSAE
jgi:predicted ester cyclase